MAPKDRTGRRLAKRFGRREAIKALGLATLSGLAAPPATKAEAAVKSWRPLATGSEPRSFTRPEFRGLEELVELILPATETPGAKDVGVHWYLDDAAFAEPRTREQIKAGLTLLDERCRAAFRKGFAEASEEERTHALTELADKKDGFFNFIKGRVVDAYYKSEAGQMGELQWVGHEFYDAFPGACPHADPLVHPRNGGRR